MSDLYRRCCNDLGLTPQRISSYISNLLEFSQSVPFSQIPNYISQKIEEKKRVEQEIENLKDQVEVLQKQRSETESRTKLALDNHKITEDKLIWYSKIKDALEKRYGIPVDDISKFASMVNGVKQHFGYDAQKVINEFSHSHLILAEYTELQAGIANLKYQHNIESKEYSNIKQKLETAKQSLCIYRELSASGFGLEELKSLQRAILRIADANNVHREKALNKFFKDISEQYDGKLGFQSKIDKLQGEVNKLSQEKTRLHGEINSIPRLGPLLVKLLDIFNSNNTSIEEIELLIDKLRKSGGIKAAISKLDQPTQDKKEARRGTSQEEEAVLVDDANKSSSNDKVQKGEQPVIVSATGEDNHDDELIEAQFRPMVKKPIAEISPPEPPSMRALLAGNGNDSNDSSTTKLKRDQVYEASAGVIKQIGSQQIIEEDEEGESKRKEQEKEELRSLQQKIKNIDDSSHYYVPGSYEC